jgi:hypothetical protein
MALWCRWVRIGPVLPRHIVWGLAGSTTVTNRSRSCPACDARSCLIVYLPTLKLNHAGCVCLENGVMANDVRCIPINQGAAVR